MDRSVSASPTGRRDRSPTTGVPSVAVALAALLALSLLSGCAVPVFGSTGDETSIEFASATEESGLAYDSKRLGSYAKGNEGLYVADVNRDGWADVLAIGGERPALYANENGTFERSGQLSSLAGEYRTATFVDYDGDGWRDLILLGKGREMVAFHNDEGTFERTDVGLGETAYPAGAVAADFDGDGDLDLFVYQSGTWAKEPPQAYQMPVDFVDQDNGHDNQLYENVGGEFERVRGAGFDGGHWTLAASGVDLNGDGLPDVHAANDFWYDRVYVNRGNMTFEARRLGEPTARNAMSSEVGDVNGDGHPDLFVTNIYLPLREHLSRERFRRIKMLLGFVVESGKTNGSNLLVNDGTGNFTDRAPAYGVRKGGWAWAASFADFDNDGDDDLLHTTQKVVRLNETDPKYTLPMIRERRGDEFVTLDASERGLEEANGRGMVALDYDHDGDIEVVTNNIDSNVTVYDNVGTTGNALQFRVATGPGNRTAVGATVTVEYGGESQTVFVTDQTDFLSQEPLANHVGLGDADSATLTVRWPDGTERTFEDVAAGQRVRVTKDGVETVFEFSE
ncbi:MAG: CRTAC1 family protein [Haloarculaceae archaeon]